MDEYWRVELDRGVPEFVERELAEIGALDVGGDHEASGAELLHGIFGFARGCGRVRQRHRGEQGEFARMLAAQLGQALVQEPMPACGGRGRNP